MNDLVREQLQFLFAAFCFGMATICLYDGLRLIRWLFSHTKAVTAAEDIIFWMGMSVCCYLVFLEYNDGIVRWYGMVCVFAGAVLYEIGISKVIRKKCNQIFLPVRTKLKQWLYKKKKKRILCKVQKKREQNCEK